MEAFSLPSLRGNLKEEEGEVGIEVSHLLLAVETLNFCGENG